MGNASFGVHRLLGFFVVISACLPCEALPKFVGSRFYSKRNIDDWSSEPEPRTYLVEKDKGSVENEKRGEESVESAFADASESQTMSSTTVLLEEFLTPTTATPEEDNFSYNLQEDFIDQRENNFTDLILATETTEVNRTRRNNETETYTLKRLVTEIHDIKKYLEVISAKFKQACDVIKNDYCRVQRHLSTGGKFRRSVTSLNKKYSTGELMVNLLYGDLDDMEPNEVLKGIDPAMAKSDTELAQQLERDIDNVVVNFEKLLYEIDGLLTEIESGLPPMDSEEDSTDDREKEERKLETRRLLFYISRVTGMVAQNPEILSLVSDVLSECLSDEKVRKNIDALATVLGKCIEDMQEILEKYPGYLDACLTDLQRQSDNLPSNPVLPSSVNMITTTGPTTNAPVDCNILPATDPVDLDAVSRSNPFHWGLGLVTEDSSESVVSSESHGPSLEDSSSAAGDSVEDSVTSSKDLLQTVNRLLDSIKDFINEFEPLKNKMSMEFSDIFESLRKLIAKKIKEMEQKDRGIMSTQLPVAPGDGQIYSGVDNLSSCSPGQSSTPANTVSSDLIEDNNDKSIEDDFEKGRPDVMDEETSDEADPSIIFNKEEEEDIPSDSTVSVNQDADPSTQPSVHSPTADISSSNSPASSKSDQKLNGKFPLAINKHEKSDSGVNYLLPSGAASAFAISSPTFNAVVAATSASFPNSPGGSGSISVSTSGTSQGGISPDISLGSISSGTPAGQIPSGIPTGGISYNISPGSISSGSVLGDVPSGNSPGSISSGIPLGDIPSETSPGDPYSKSSPGSISSGSFLGDVPSGNSPGSITSGIPLGDVPSEISSGDVPSNISPGKISSDTPQSISSPKNLPKMSPISAVGSVSNLPQTKDPNIPTDDITPVSNLPSSLGISLSMSGSSPTSGTQDSQGTSHPAVSNIPGQILQSGSTAKFPTADSPVTGMSAPSGSPNNILINMNHPSPFLSSAPAQVSLSKTNANVPDFTMASTNRQLGPANNVFINLHQLPALLSNIMTQSSSSDGVPPVTNVNLQSESYTNIIPKNGPDSSPAIKSYSSSSSSEEDSDTTSEPGLSSNSKTALPVNWNSILAYLTNLLAGSPTLSSTSLANIQTPKLGSPLNNSPSLSLSIDKNKIADALGKPFKVGDIIAISLANNVILAGRITNNNSISFSLMGNNHWSAGNLHGGNLWHLSTKDFKDSELISLFENLSHTVTV